MRKVAQTLSPKHGDANLTRRADEARNQLRQFVRAVACYRPALARIMMSQPSLFAQEW